jgi:hypothetical protein
MDKLLFRRILVTVLSLLAIIYAVYLIVSANFDMYTTENAVEVTVTNTIYSDGFIIRDESLINNSSQGVLSYSLNDGDSVKVGGEIAKIYSSDSDAAAQTKADNLEVTMNALQDLQKTYTNNSLGIDTINNDINNGIISLLGNINSNDIQSTSSNISSLISSINQRQVYTGKVSDFSGEIADLQAQIDDLRNSSGSSIGTITSDKSGYFSAYCDGYENAFSYSDIDRITLDDLENVTKSKVSDNVAGKVISSLDWYVACKVTADEATELSLWDGDATVLFSNAFSDSIPATITRIYQESDSSDAVLVLKCNYMNSELVDARREPIEIGLGTYKGLRISKKAIHDDYVENTVYDDDNNKHTEREKVQGVYVLYGSEVHFKQISILYSEEDYVICDEEPDSGKLFNGETVSLYDKVIVEGDDIYDGKVFN